MEYHYVLTDPGPRTTDISATNMEDTVDDAESVVKITMTGDGSLNVGNEINGHEICSNENTVFENNLQGNDTVVKDDLTENSTETSCDMIDSGDMIENNAITVHRDMINTREITKNDNVGGENLDLSKVKKENTHEDEMYGTLRENEDYNLDADTEPEDDINGDIAAHSKGDNSEVKNSNDLDDVLDNINLENVKPEIDPETQVIVLNRHNKFNSRPKPDPNILRYKCDKCEDAFQFPYQLARHKNIKHEGKYPYYCKVCSKPFDRSSSLRDHMYVHTDNRPFQCKLCDKSFKMKGNLRKHIRDMHSESEGPKLKFQCEYCSKIFLTKQRLTSHFLVHDTEKPFACNICGKRFNRKNNLKEHVVIHSTEKNFVCPDCGMRFNRKYSLKIHARNHMEVKPYKCELCPSSFSQLHALKTHFRLHTGEKPFKCTICEKTFRQLATLQVHFKRHTGVKDFKCGICGKGFVIRRRLIEHERLHTGEKPFSCDLCPYRAATSSGLRLHKKTHMRQMQRLAMQKVENSLNDGHENEKVDSKQKETVTRRNRLPPLTVSTKFLEKKSAEVNSTEDAGNEGKDDSVENVDEEEALRPVVNGEVDAGEGTEEIPESLSNESVIEIVNDITGAEVYSIKANADIEIVNDEERTENIMDISDTGATENVEVSLPLVQVAEVIPEVSSVKKARKITSKTAKTKENEFETLTKEVLYKHLNDFIPAIDADVLTEKVDLITKELFEIHGKSATKKSNLQSSKKSKKKSENVSEKNSIRGSLEISNGMFDNSVSLENSSRAILLQGCATNPPDGMAGMSTFGTQTILDEAHKKPTNTPKSKTLNTLVKPIHDKPIIRQLLSASAPQTSHQSIALQSAMPSLNRGDLSQNPSSQDKPFFSTMLRNMLVSKKPNHLREHSDTMATAGVSVKKENIQSTFSSPAGSSVVLRDILSTPPKHYLVSTKNSYAAMQRSIKRQNTLASSHNGFDGQWHTAGKVEETSDFPWVEEKNNEPSPPMDISISSIKIEPMSP